MTRRYDLSKLAAGRDAICRVNKDSKMEAFDLLRALGVPALILLKDGSAYEGMLQENGDGTYSVPSGRPRVDAARFTADDVEAIKVL